MLTLLLIGSIFLFFILFVLFDLWERARRRILITVLVVLLSVELIAVGILYQLANDVGCLPQCAGENLVNRNFRGQNLAETDFVQADLSNSDFTQSDLQGADLRGAIMWSVRLEGADLTNANLIGADLTGANLIGADLTGANLSGANLSGANLAGVDLTHTSVMGARFSNAQLVAVNLTGAQLNSVDFSGADMKGARLPNANLSGAVLSGADLSGAQMSNSQLVGAWLNLAILIGANLNNSDLSGSSLIAANLASADLADSNLIGSNLIGANLKGANLRSTDLRDVSLDLSKLADEDIARDSLLAELNELRRSQLLVDAQLAGASFDSQTLWPESPITQRLITQQAEVSAIVADAAERFNVGLLHSLSGPLAIGEAGMRDAILLAIDEINATGGVLGQMVEPIVEDGAGTPELFVEKATKLLEEDQVVAIFGASTSPNRKAVIPIVEAADSLLFYPAAYEGFEQSPHTIYLGAEPSQQIVPAIDYLVRQGISTFGLVGSDGLYSRRVNEIIKQQLGAVDLVVVGEIYVSEDAANITQAIDQLHTLQPGVIVNTIQGEANLTFFRLLDQAGLTAQDLPVLNLTIGEAEIRLLGAELMEGHWVAATYFQTSQEPGNAAFITAFRTAYGEDRVVSDAMASAYSAVYLWKALVEAAKSTDATAIQNVIAGQSIVQTTPKGQLLIDSKTQHTFLTAQLGVIRQDGLIDVIYMSETPLQPDPYLTQFEWAPSFAEGSGEEK